MIVLFTGDMGSGKTLTMTKFLYEDWQGGAEIYSNYKLLFGRGQRLNYLTAKFFKNYKQFDVKHASVAIDEAHVFLDSRNAMGKMNKLLTKFITQSRKRGVTLYATTQRYLQVDVRLRRLTDILVRCKKLKKLPGCVIQLEFWNMTKDPPTVMGRSTIQGEEVYALYDTNEIIDMEEEEEEAEA